MWWRSLPSINWAKRLVNFNELQNEKNKKKVLKKNTKFNLYIFINVFNILEKKMICSRMEMNTELIGKIKSF